MIFCIDRNADWAQVALTPDLKTGITELLRAHRHGKHLVTGTRAHLRSLGEQLELYPADRAALDRMIERAAQDLPLAQNSPVSVIVTPDDADLTQNGSNYRIGLARIDQSGLLGRASLVVEDVPNDGGFMSIYLRQALKKSQLPYFNYNIQHGGGGRLAAVALQRMSEGRVTVCLCDTDRSAPNDRLGGTASAVERALRTKTWPHHLALTPGREIENLLPEGGINYLVNQAALPRWQDLVNAARNSDEYQTQDCLLLYFDLKCGVDLVALRANGKAAQADWLESKLVGTFPGVTTSPIDGFGDRLVPQTVDPQYTTANFVQQAIHEFSQTSLWKSLIQPFLEEILWYLAAAPAQRST